MKADCAMSCYQLAGRKGTLFSFTLVATVISACFYYTRYVKLRFSSVGPFILEGLNDIELTFITVFFRDAAHRHYSGKRCW